PSTYAAFRDLLDRHVSVFQPQSAPDALPPLPQHSEGAFTALPTLSQLGLGEPLQAIGSAFPFSGGETAGHARLRDYFWEGLQVREYAAAGQRMGSENSSKLSPWLANGCLSTRRVAAELRRHEAHY